MLYKRVIFEVVYGNFIGCYDFNVFGYELAPLYIG